MRSLFSIIFLFITSLSFGQYTVSGEISTTKGEALIGASVFLVGTPYATITDEKGKFILENVEEGEYFFKATYVGFKDHAEDVNVDQDITVNAQLAGGKFEIQEIEITANRLNERSAYSFVELEKEDIQFKNLAQDLPFMVEHTPSMVVTSDAGAGVGYTGMRIRGSDATRINVTVNGVPLNDSESHGVFWVNMPDFATSVNNIQIQRGVGPSTNGAGAFGATVNLDTKTARLNPYITLEGSYGSFNTRKISASVGSGLINNQFTIDGRYSLIESDGFIDRASSELRSWFFSAAKIGEKSFLRFNAFSGDERTYQAWWGVPESKFDGDQNELMAHYQRNLGSTYNTPQDSINLFDSENDQYNYYLYDNQVDDYRQSHYQMIYGVKASDNFNLNTTLHYTRGQGIFEEFRYQDDIADYGISNVRTVDGNPLEVSNLVRRRWLDNHFYGLVFNGDWSASDKIDVQFGGGINRYDGDHFGNVIDIEGADLFSFDPENDYYFSASTKDDRNLFAKLFFNPSSKFQVFADAQIRSINYVSEGTDNDLTPIAIDTSYLFFNPKFGFNYILNENSQIYASLARAQREPVRSDFIDAVGVDVPSHESLWDLELGWSKKADNWSLNTNVYYMKYTDQLVLTGAVNISGSPIRVNVEDSYRAGIELSGQYKFNDKLSWSPNISLSQNRIAEFTEVVVDFVQGDLIRNDFEDTDIAFSPNIIFGSILEYNLDNNFSFSLLSKYVGKQFLDNTNDETRSLDAYFLSDFVASYNLSTAEITNINLKLVVNNIFNASFASNGYTFNYALDRNVIQENFLYPQAGTNFLLGASFTF